MCAAGYNGEGRRYLLLLEIAKQRKDGKMGMRA
jgi:hypothetical protein